MSQVLMSGLFLPPALGRGKPSAEAVEPWLQLVEELMGRGVRTPSQLRRLTGVGHRTASNWMKEVRRRWTTGLTDDRINWRREVLYSEADQVARAAWCEAAVAETSSEKASLFKVILMANQRKAALTGLDGLEVKIKKDITISSSVDLVARVETQHGLAPGALELIGRQAARALSGGVLELPGKDVLEIEAVEKIGGVDSEPYNQTPLSDSITECEFTIREESEPDNDVVTVAEERAEV